MVSSKQLHCRKVRRRNRGRTTERSRSNSQRTNERTNELHRRSYIRSSLLRLDYTQCDTSRRVLRGQAYRGHMSWPLANCIATIRLVQSASKTNSHSIGCGSAALSLSCSLIGCRRLALSRFALSPPLCSPLLWLGTLPLLPFDWLPRLHGVWQSSCALCLLPLLPTARLASYFAAHIYASVSMRVASAFSRRSRTVAAVRRCHCRCHCDARRLDSQPLLGGAVFPPTHLIDAQPTARSCRDARRAPPRACHRQRERTRNERGGLCFQSPQPQRAAALSPPLTVASVALTPRPPPASVLIDRGLLRPPSAAPSPQASVSSPYTYGVDVRRLPPRRGVSASGRGLCASGGCTPLRWTS